MDRMTSMATFVKVVESGGFSAAARTLSMSPSMVTAHVQSLEERLGVRLLNRSTRRVSLTEVGHAYYERCLQILADADDADLIAQALQSTPRGTLRLNTSIAIPPLLAPVIAEFVALYPEVSINLTMTDRIIDLVEEGFDLAVRNMSVPDSSLVVRRVATYRFVVCGAPGYLATRGIPRQPADLVHHNCLVYSHSGWGNEWRFAGPDGEQSVAVVGNLQANSDNALRLAAVHARGSRWRRAFCSSMRSNRVVSFRSCPNFCRPSTPSTPSTRIATIFRRRSAASSTSWSSTFMTIPAGPIPADLGYPRSLPWALPSSKMHRPSARLGWPMTLPPSITNEPTAAIGFLRALPRRRDFASLPDRRRRRAGAAVHGAGANRHRGREPLLSPPEWAAGARAGGRVARRARA